MDFFSVGLFLAGLSFLSGAVWRLRGETPAPGTLPAKSTPRPSGGNRARRVLAGVTDVLFLRRTWRTGRLRWTGHMLLVLGFLPLLFLHAMDGIVTRPLFPAYEPTLDPWQFMRNLCGLASVCGLGLLTGLRLTDRRLRNLSRAQDWALLGVLGMLLVSGFVLETVKIISPAEFTRMTDDYFPEAEPGELIALQTHWARENGVRFTRFLPTAPEILSLGRELHEDRCASCHAPTATAFVSRSLADLLPAAVRTPRNGPIVFWHLHAGLAFLALGLLSWGKFFHPLGTSANLLLRGGTTVSDTDRRHEPGRSKRRALALQACTRCGQCSLHCSVAPSHLVLGNRDILPMEKLDDLRRHLKSGLHGTELGDLVEGSQICTECLRCTDICPAGIDLQDLWIASKQALTETGLPGVDGEIRKRTAGEWARELSALRLDTVGGIGSGLADRAQSFWGCVQCTTCTGVCPVVAVSENPSRDLDLTPQQIMNLLRMGLKAQTLGARMVWSCTTCYKCQEHCPQGVPVADILYELRGLGAEILRDRRGRG
jgi:heterodisulfide reductase subunit C/nitrate reductase gamma subunit